MRSFDLTHGQVKSCILDSPCDPAPCLWRSLILVLGDADRLESQMHGEARVTTRILRDHE